MNVSRSQPGSELDQLVAWVLEKCPSPPPHLIKLATLKQYARAHNCTVFIETGTGLGITTAEMANLGLECHTIELDTPRYLQMRERFRNSPNITTHHGDSELVLPKILASLTGKALFWLDAHYSWDGLERAEKETPIVAEVRAILDHPITGHVILIDDMRLFGNARGERYRDYPAISELQSMFSSRPLNIEILYDIMRITPRGEAL